MTTGPTTLIECLSQAAERFPDYEAFAFLPDGEHESDRITYGQIDRRARAIAALLQSEGKPGDRVLLIPASHLDFIPAFFGCLIAGRVAVPASPPQNRHQIPRLEAICKDSQAHIALADAKTHEWIQMHAEARDLQSLDWISTEPASKTGAEPRIEISEPAFLQYTSGATASPKGVMVTHANLINNLVVISEAFQITPDDIGVFWLPVYHDMGLIGGVLSNIFVAAQSQKISGRTFLMPPAAFVESPIRWLRAITQVRATITGAPNFAYDYCVDHIPASQRDGLDLSCLKTAFCGAETVLPATLERFTREFAKQGFQSATFQPVYGLAENTLLVTHSPLRRNLIKRRVQRQALEEGRVQDIAADQHDAQVFASCGSSPSGQTVLLVDPGTRDECPPDRVGEIWVAGSSVALGYWNRPSETMETFQAYLPASRKGPFLRTGDLGFTLENELFIVGRLKDLIVIRGRNYMPGDLEQSAETSHPSIQHGGCAAFSVESTQGEHLVLVVELERQQRHADFESVASAIRGQISAVYGLETYAIVVLRPGGLPRTSSGKVQHSLCRQRYLDDSLEAVGTSLGPLQRKATGGESSLQDLVQAELRSQLSSMLAVPIEQVDLNIPIRELGLGSIHAVALKYAIEKKFNIYLPPETFDSQETLAELVKKWIVYFRTPPER
jgi:acyl-CoA synthetase (AMP-forming)/AMP-acid ligase II/acyl carrier protein